MGDGGSALFGRLIADKTELSEFAIGCVFQLDIGDVSLFAK